MKTWTVMLIPHDRGGTRTLTLSSLHFWTAVGVLALLTFSTAFLYQRDRAHAQNTRAHQDRIQGLERQLAQAPGQAVGPETSNDAELRAIEARLSTEYESSIAAITAELAELHDAEARAREVGLLEPRASSLADTTDAAGGKGGPTGADPVAVYAAVDAKFRPPQVIYGMLQPSADLIIQEIRTRTTSLNELIADSEAKRDRMARVPMGRPLPAGVGRYSSHFGYRRDPFTRRVRHHSGTDISAPTGTSIYATARGVVVASEYDGAYGHIVKVDHGNGLQTWYAHMSKRLANVGEEVERGDRIGRVGSTGRSTGPHIHYEVRVGKKPVDPRKYLPN